MSVRFNMFATGVIVSAPLGVTSAEDPPSAIDGAKQAVVNWKPETKAAKVDQERLTVRRLDVVDENGTIRMTLGSPTPQPIVDGLQYKRVFPVSGLVIYDKDGGERGGFGVADIADSAVVTENYDVRAEHLWASSRLFSLPRGERKLAAEPRLMIQQTSTEPLPSAARAYVGSIDCEGSARDQ